MKSCNHKQLAIAAGVSVSTFYRWLQSDRKQLEQLGVRPGAKVLPPAAVKYIVKKYDIELDE